MKKIIVILIMITINLFGTEHVVKLNFSSFTYNISISKDGFFFKGNGFSTKAIYHNHNREIPNWISGSHKFVSFFELLDSGGVNTTTINLTTGLTWHSRHTREQSKYSTYMSNEDLKVLQVIFLDN